MNQVFFLLLAFTFVSCNEKVIESYDDLTPDEQEEIRNYSYLRCKSQYQSIYDRFKNTSNEVFDSSSFDRENGFYFEYKQGTASDVKKKMDIRIWKRDGTLDEIYFYITDVVLGSESYFLRLTRSENEEMIDDLLEDHCLRPLIYTSSSADYGPLSISYSYDKINAPNTDSYVDVYSLPFSNPAFFANFRISRKVTTTDSNGDAVGTAVSYSSTLISKTYSFDSYTDPSDSSRYTQKFCNPATESAVVNGATVNVFRFSQDTSFFGFKIDCVEGTAPVGWNLTL